MKLEDIGFYTLSDERAKNSSPTSQMKRCEIVLTYKCNFNCSYCRGIRGDYRAEMPIEDVKHVINEWSKDYLENIRFSGGEPTLYPYIFDAVAYAKSKNIKRIAISTNGSADLGVYKRLIYLGVNDFSISLDACCASDGKRMANISESMWDKLILNIKELSKIAYVTTGIVLTEDNIDNTWKIVEYAHDLGVQDIRIITAAQHNANLADYVKTKSIIEDHPILKYRIENISNGKAIRGLKDTDFRKCPLILDDSAVASKYHFPCIIYMREGGYPIGSIFEDMRRERYRYFLKKDVYSDPICRINCLDVCVGYNNKWMDFDLKNSRLERMPIDYFDASKWRSGSFFTTKLNLSCRYNDITSDYGKKMIQKHAVGWAPGHLLPCRPKSDSVGVMWFIDGEHGWCHMRKNEFWEVFCK